MKGTLLQNESVVLPLVSIITVVLNQKKFLEKAIQSVLHQTYNNIEHVIIDGGSTDGTLDIIRAYEHRLAHWISEPDRGLYDAINKGLRMCSGTVIGILNSDDWYEPDAVASVVHAFRSSPEALLVCGAMRIWSVDGCCLRMKSQRHILPMYCVMPFNHPTCFFRSDVYATIGQFDTSFPTAADYDLILRFLKSYGSSTTIKLLDRVLTNFRQGGVTTQLGFPPLDQIWRILRKNDYNIISSCIGIFYRLIRNTLSLLTRSASLKGIL